MTRKNEEEEERGGARRRRMEKGGELGKEDDSVRFWNLPETRRTLSTASPNSITTSVTSRRIK